MSSKRELIIQAIVAAVDAVPGLNVYRSRVLAMGESKLPAAVVSPATNQPVEGVVGMADNVLEIELAIRVAGTDAAADPFIVAAHAALMADRTLGGHAIDIAQRDSAWAFSAEGKDLCELRATYAIHYRTQTNDLTS